MSLIIPRGKTNRYNLLIRAAYNLALVYQLSKDRRYAQKSAEILLLFSQRYRSYSIHNTFMKPGKTGGRLLSQTLDESVWLLRAVASYDMIAESGALSMGQKVDIEWNLIRAAIATIQRYDAGKSNWQAWHNAAIGAAGYALNEKNWVTQALKGKSGFAYHIKNSMLADGFWYEGSIGYHNYTLSAYHWLALAAKQAGQNLYTQGLLKMVKAPLLMAFPNQSFPKLNDGGTGSLLSMRNFFEVAFAFTQDKEILAVLQFIYNDLKQSRAIVEALLLGATLTGKQKYSPKGFNFTATGYAIIRQGSSFNALYAGLDYGPHGGWHGHFDKIQLIFFGGQQLLLSDPGTTSYRLPYHNGYFKQSIAHNTIMFGEKNQSTGQETPRKLNFFRTLSLPQGPGLSSLQASVGSDVFGSSRKATRSLLMIANHVLVDSLEVYNPTQQSVDLLFHSEGLLEISNDARRGTFSPAVSWSKSKAGHAYLQTPSMATGKAKGILEGTFQPTGPLRVHWQKKLSIGHPMESTTGLSQNREVKTVFDHVQGTASVPMDRTQQRECTILESNVHTSKTRDR